MARPSTLTARQHEPAARAAPPVAIVGVGCRFPGGADSADSFWEMLANGRDATGMEVPAGRWDGYRSLGPEYAAALRRATRHGSFLSSIDGFDAEFFGLSPREAELMDPQHRLLLEVAWESLEHAGVPAQTLAGSDTGVFVGVSIDDYGRRMLEELPSIDAWTGIGSSMCAAANRISHALDLRGPSLALDTACSSSLVALHLACESLARAESRVALAGGVNLIVSPGVSLALDAAGALADDGRSKPFDADANGYGRGEGCGMVVLKRLDDAERDGDQILSVILGSGVAQDGRTNGIMAPSGTAQQELLSQVCQRAGVEPLSVDYVEAHGTGTRLGDPLEATAISGVYGNGRPPDAPCLIGSVKSNIGHLEPAAGVAGLIKTILALRQAEVPQSLHLSTPNPAIDWPNSGLSVAAERTRWPARPGAPRRAGVSAYGFGGTIAHVLVEQAPEPAASPPAAARAQLPGSRLFSVSASCETALREHAAGLADWLEGHGREAPLDSVGFTLGRRRSHLAQRAAVVARDHATLADGLRRVAAGDAAPGVASGRVLPAAEAGAVWVFGGHGSQWVGMGRELMDTEPAFAHPLDTLEPVYREEAGFSLRQVLLDGDLKEDVCRIQSAIFSVQVGLAELWRTAGVVPAAVIGHSVGEVAAAVASGGLSLLDGARLSCRRSALLRQASGTGAMAMTDLPFQEAAARLEGRTDVVPAILASPSSTAISGELRAVEEVAARWQADGVTVRRIATDIAFHSPQTDHLLDEAYALAEDLSPAPPRTPMYTTALDDPRGLELTDPGYWVANMRNPVRLSAAVEAAVQDGFGCFIELSPHPVVSHSIQEVLAELDLDDAFVCGSLRRNTPERETLLANIGAAHCHGLSLNWPVLQPEGRMLELPWAPWQRQRLWWESIAPAAGEGLCHQEESHTLLGSPVSVAGRSTRLWRTRLTYGNRPYPGSHSVNGTEVAPASVLINTFLQAMPDGDTAAAVTDVRFHAPLLLDGARDVQVVHDDGALRICARASDRDASWLTHTTARHPAAGQPALPVALPAQAGPRQPAEPDEVRRYLASVGVPDTAFDWNVDTLTRGDGVVRARVRLEVPPQAEPTWAPILDAALSIAPLALSAPPTLRLIARIGEVRTAGSPLPAFDVVATAGTDEGLTVLVAEPDGAVMVRLADMRLAELDPADTTVASPDRLVHEVAWRELAAPAGNSTGTGTSTGTSTSTSTSTGTREVVLVGPETDLARNIVDALSRAGARCRRTPDAAALTGLDRTTDVLVLAPLAESDGPPAPAATTAAWLLTTAAQRLAGTDRATPPRLWCLSVGVRESRERAQLAHAPLWGLGRVIATEHPDVWGGVIDLPPDDPGAAAGTLLDLMQERPAEDVIAIRDGTAEVARLVPSSGEPARGPVSCRPEGTYLVTGGLGVLGLQVAHWLAERGARRIVLVGRQPLLPRGSWDRPTDAQTRRRIEGVQALESLGVTVRVLALDIADPRRAARQLTPNRLDLPPIRGVVHAAGVLDNRLVRDVDEQSLRTVLRPKVEGAWTLHTLFPPGSLDFLVLFSSCGQLLGVPGQATYGSANAFLDALAQHRNATAAGMGDTLSLAWTSWRGQGMAVNEAVDAEMRARGVAAISPPEAFGAWDFAHRRGPGTYPVLPVVTAEPVTEDSPVLWEARARSTAEPAGTEAPAAQYADLSPDELQERLLVDISSQVANEMKLPVSSLDPRRPLIEQGLDSVMTIVVRRRLERQFGHKLPSTLLWQQPTLAAIADYVAGVLIPAEPDQIATGADLEREEQA